MFGRLGIFNLWWVYQEVTRHKLRRSVFSSLPSSGYCNSWSYASMKGKWYLFACYFNTHALFIFSAVSPIIPCVCAQAPSHVQLFATLWTAVHQASLSMGLSLQEYWSRLPFPSPGDLPNPGIAPTSPALAGRFFITETLRKLISILFTKFWNEQTNNPPLQLYFDWLALSQFLRYFHYVFVFGKILGLL